MSVLRLFLAGGFAVTFLIYFPVLWLALLSVSADPLSGLPGGFTLGWYAQLLATPGWVEPLERSLVLAAIVALLCMVAATALGRALPRLRRGRNLLLALFLLPLGVPGVVMGLVLFVFYRMIFGLHLGLWSLVLSHFVWAFPFALIGMLVVSLRFDLSLLEAAADLGASPWRRFWDIERPLLMPGIVTAGLFGFLMSFTELPRSLFVHGGQQTLPLYDWAEASSHASHIPLIFCLTTVVTLVSVAASAGAVLLLGRRAR